MNSGHTVTMPRGWSKAFFLMILSVFAWGLGMQPVQAAPETDPAISRAVERELLTDPGVTEGRSRWKTIWRTNRGRRTCSRKFFGIICFQADDPEKLL